MTGITFVDLAAIGRSGYVLRSPYYVLECCEVEMMVVLSGDFVVCDARKQDKIDKSMDNRRELFRLDCESVYALDALAKISGKWKLRIVFHLLDGKKRFSELRRLLSGISRGTLTFELRQLMGHGIIERTQYPTIPPTVEYELTDRGVSLRPILEALCEWDRLGRELPKKEASIMI